MPRQMVFHKNFCDVLSAPRFQAEVLATLPRGAAVAAGPAADGWQRAVLPDGREGYVREGILSPYLDAPPDLPERDLRQRLCRTALLYRGAPYRWGGKTPMGIDCSGLVSMAYLLWGIPIYRDARIEEGFPVHEISRGDMGPADLLFFPGHVAMYLGEGRYCHATGRTGDGGFAVNSLDPAAPDYRADLAEKLTAVGSVFQEIQRVVKNFIGTERKSCNSCAPTKDF